MALQTLLSVLALTAVSSAAAFNHGQRRLLQDSPASNPTTITISSDPYEVIATPITPQVPYSQAAYQCNVSGDSRIPGLATFPLTVQVPQGKYVKVTFANGYVSTSGSDSGSSPVATVDTTSANPTQDPSSGGQDSSGGQYTPGADLAGNSVTSSSSSSSVSSAGRKLLQDTVPGGPNNGQVEYVSLSSSNTVPGFVVSNGQFGVTDLQYTASGDNVGQTATFKGVLQVAQVYGGVPQIPFYPNPSLSPECQVNVNFVTI